MMTNTEGTGAMPKKKNKLKLWVYNLLFVLSGAVIGEVIAALSKGVKPLSWLAYKVNIGIVNPLDIDIIIAKFKFGFYFVINPALVLFIVIALVVGNMFITKK